MRTRRHRQDLTAPEVIATLRASGHLVWVIDGVLDALVCRNKTMCWLEIKSPGGKASPEQLKLAEEWPVIFATTGIEAIEKFSEYMTTGRVPK